MADLPWLTIIGLGEDGADGLSAAARAALEKAELVIGAPRHLSLLPALRCEARAWPAPFAEGIPLLLAERGRRVVVLASGDPFWFGAGTSVTPHLAREEWTAHPVPSSFALAASRLGWALQDTLCLGLHAAPFGLLRPHLAPGQHLLVTVRDGAAVASLAAYLAGEGFGASTLHVLEALGGPRERVRSVRADTLAWEDIAHPVCIGIEPAGAGAVLPVANGRPDGWFESDGQLTKQPVRALTLSALAPRAGELLWDIGAGSGSIGIEWLLAHPANRAIAVEADPVRAERARANAARLGVDRLRVVPGRAPAVLPEGVPDAVFIGGGLSQALLEALWARLPTGVRLVANAVTLESEALLATWHGAEGGSLLRIELADAAPLGTRHGWRSRYPVVQWSVTR
ncbi:precorrin-6y C5,15-methyltransferase (decarboxylating) subunit CbiE [Sphingomonas sp. ABOLD]|uniref:Precorrin-6Y C5,15-methyltransferase (Decarboxylating) n=1 Tax=Sphingomonas trueperi TaxID=53317 RepID=A0A7X5Y2Y2_9SPHN|nr:MULTISPECIES: precorrin-6y C5,15-methyltransferase (decarboxylating) subunit CbiE [Sphingomonas]NJB99655.1 precorrin-6Y C5,15-methyltransferase (decarboxylating) [Sphingomonas trueperi]RSV37411.1 precorrin-6y C5,15-methyltransferase (decarboxylating) subunit CbiE [Sphingomonas sp. ABOLE]RSV50628.1 precorrin-6y C5,15-methyltransferase (decarboxylating) subunit CbiE [Sphingomonas sp. ABOLD]